ncbi:pyridoxamine 5'-phosphate oxidase-related FMN-binding protein [Paenibacillus curdlanolyticus YK9]|uniref:Pyridoxamine 5'-phosphate oxidase-related FMN-binding protein n=1 Tax=Paenibacillus curdlanolyticus YK9 TaxID=717606 RepID=E0I7N0_9BACL|nr:pyridoxamine 5'-phosphate oxidase family protein [Paenibacillus curdlanolyticus]EFM11185.1 pyridoxamine 5'-phosphate oxidase-related FMN-binding protein [Paenibacillus curdlanolyticus YK9]
MKSPDLAKMQQQFSSFISSMKSLTLGTINEEGKPFLSYAPFALHQGKLYIYISRIAQHYRHLEANPSADVMLIEDESRSANLFARQRARFACTAINVGNEGCEPIFALLEQSFGEPMIGMLRELDFSLFELIPLEGRYVVGFGQTFDIDVTGERFELAAIDRS